jgi:hypothetical protein
MYQITNLHIHLGVNTFPDLLLLKFAFVKFTVLHQGESETPVRVSGGKVVPSRWLGRVRHA